MDTAKIRKNYEECSERAKRASDKATQTRWLAMAQYWLQKIEAVEGNTKSEPSQNG